MKMNVLYRSSSVMVSTKSFHKQLPHGNYYIGDICYVLRDDVFQDVWCRNNHCEPGYYEIEDGSFCVGTTAFGDGYYLGSDNERYPVDAGNIGIVSAGLIDVGARFNKKHLHKFHGPVTFKWDGIGIFQVVCEADDYTLVIDTNDEH